MYATPGEQSTHAGGGYSIYGGCRGQRTIVRRASYNPRMKPRRQTRSVQVGDARTGIVTVGGGCPRVRADDDRGLHVRDRRLRAPRSTSLARGRGRHWSAWRCPMRKDTEALPEILRQTRVPIVADVHFPLSSVRWRPIEAGVHKIRLNPGNISDRDEVNAVIDACKDARYSRSASASTRVRSSSASDKQQRLEELGPVLRATRSTAT
jgi:(E)-4-hydroxy-3-methylbut-2-enyl-diphosphate synthase